MQNQVTDNEDISMASRSNISNVFNLYDKALEQTRSRLESRIVESTNELELFYNQFLKDHIVKYADLFRNEPFRREMHRELEQRYRSSTLRFWAIDGTCKKIDTSDLAIFYGGACVKAKKDDGRRTGSHSLPGMNIDSFITFI